MEVKKNPKVDVGRNSSLYFAIGLNLMLLTTYLMFEHKFYADDSYVRDIVQMDKIVEEDIPIINIDVPPPPPPPPAIVSEDLKIVEDVDVEEVEEEISVPFSVIEHVPVFPGCESGTKEEKIACFERSIQQHVKKNFKYPETALELGMQGKVYVLFAIDKTGHVSGIRSRGPDKMLEKEAERIIGLLPKMIPGKQRGRAVKMPYSIPISFVLRN